MLGGEQERSLGSAREADDDRPLGVRGVEDGERVLGELRLSISVEDAWSVALAVAARVKSDHAEMLGKVGDLHLPHLRGHERPGRAEQDRRLAAAEHLKEDADALALDVSSLVWLACCISHTSSQEK